MFADTELGLVEHCLSQVHNITASYSIARGELNRYVVWEIRVVSGLNKGNCTEQLMIIMFNVQ